MKNKQYLLDTNILIDFLDGVPSVIEHVLKAGVNACYVSSVSIHELYYGAYLAKEKKEEYYNKEIKKINKLIEYFDILPLSEQHLVLVGEIVLVFLSGEINEFVGHYVLFGHFLRLERILFSDYNGLWLLRLFRYDFDNRRRNGFFDRLRNTEKVFGFVEYGRVIVIIPRCSGSDENQDSEYDPKGFFHITEGL